MLRTFFSISGVTLLSRITGFVRDVLIASYLGGSFMADAFFVALRLPNHFRSIFAEGAFNKAFIPTYAEARYAGVDQMPHVTEAYEFSNRLWTFMIICQICVLILALIGMPFLIQILAPGLAEKPETYEAAVSLTRITFPFLGFISLVTLVTGILNSLGHFVIPALAPTVMNLSMMASLLFAAFFSSPAYALAWGVALSGLLQLALVLWDSRRLNVFPQLVWPKYDAYMRLFLKRILPVTIGSAGVQLAMFLDTILASMLPIGSVSALYYADRLYQLPIGLIGIAVGTILLPTMSRARTEGHSEQAFQDQNQSLALSWVLSLPCAILFFVLPEIIIRVLFEHGAFSPHDTAICSAVLAAYAFGVPAVVLIQSILPSFYAQGDTRTPVILSLLAVTVNVFLKILFVAPLGIPIKLWASPFPDAFGAAGLAFATACGAWLNLILLWVFAVRRGWMKPTTQLKHALGCSLAASGGLTVLAYSFAQYFSTHTALSFWSSLGVLTAALGSGALLYSLLFLGGAYSLRLSWHRL
jgi:putative peptidoglycan lipid II flippase